MKKFDGVVRNRDGDAVAGAEVYVYTSGTNSLVGLYSDDGVTSTANPLSTDADGYFAAFTADATLRVKIVVGGDTLVDRSNIQHYDDLDNEVKALRSVTSAADTLFYFTGSGTGGTTPLTTAGRALIDDATAADQRTTLGLGTMATQAASAVAITGGSIAGITDLAVADGGTGASSASAARTNLGLGTIATFDEATAAQFRSNTSAKALATDKVWSAAGAVALTPGTNVSTDLSAGLNFTLAMGGNYTLDNPTNGKAGQTGCIEITQDGTGNRTLAYGTAWLFAGGTDPVLSTAASAKDLLFYQVLANGTSVYASLVKAVA